MELDVEEGLMTAELTSLSCKREEMGPKLWGRRNRKMEEGRRWLLEKDRQGRVSFASAEGVDHFGASAGSLFSI